MNQICIWLPFLGTALGAACVFPLTKMSDKVERALTGFAAGVMVAASVWSLLIPSIEQSENFGKWSVVPAAVGFLLGIAFLLLLDFVVPHLHRNSDTPEGIKSSISRTAKLVLAVTLHNIPEGMAVGAVIAGWMYGKDSISFSAALTLALGIAIQNFPEGAIISMPLRSAGNSKWKSFMYGVLSGVVEPIGAIATVLLASAIIPLLPYFLSFAAGAMIYVVIEELIPEMSQGKHSNVGTVFFSFGFVLMMVLDVTLG